MPTAKPSLFYKIDEQKSLLDKERKSLQLSFEQGQISHDVLHQLAIITDRHLRKIWKSCLIPENLCLIAVGGYGRAQLYPYSDVDILILLPNATDQIVQAKIESLISLFWDIGLDVGHSVRTITECVQLSAEDITIQTNLIESRLITGNRNLYHQFTKKMKRQINPASFLRAKMVEQKQRHAKQLETNLEPNIKESPGGLRDLNTILWVSKAGGIGNTWLALAKHGFMTREEAKAITKHEQVLQLLRIRLHYLAGRREDRLLFDHQTALAKILKFADRGQHRASERLMQRYYQTAKSVTQLNIILIQNLELRISPPLNRTIVTPINSRFVKRGELLSAPDTSIFEKDPSSILEVFCILQKNHDIKGIGAVTLRALWRSRRFINAKVRQNRLLKTYFLDILKSPSYMLRELRRMHQFDILGRYIPAFNRISGQMQHDLYHVYTVDQHILKVVRNLRRFSIPELAHEFPLCSQLMSEFDKPELLYLAGLFHDIGKGRGGDHSTLGKVDAELFCESHGLPKDDTELVSWLVDKHLVMSVTAQKSDLSDPDVIKIFTDCVSNQYRLKALYLLTVADIRGTSPKVWNGWKAKLLENLYYSTKQLLNKDPNNRDLKFRNNQEDARTQLRLMTIDEDSYLNFWQQLDTAYFLRHNGQEIAWHTRHLHQHVNTKQPIVKVRLSPIEEGLQVLVYLPDQPELFSRICSFFEGISFDIFEAKVHTTHNGYALDTFDIQDSSNQQTSYRDIMSFIEHELEARLRNRAPLPELTKSRLNRQMRHFPITPKISIQADDKGDYRMLAIVAGDRPGLLSRISRTLTTFNINLHAAKITTLGSRAEDNFLISGAALNDSKQLIHFEEALLSQLRI